MLGQKLEVNGVELHYEKIGTGSTVVLLLPGGIGTSRTDFQPQLDTMNKRNFTLVAWDPPGYGFSRPPERVYNAEQTFYSDGNLAAALMQKLGYGLYSVMGWSDGAKTALTMAIQFPARIDKMVIWGGSAYINQSEHRALAATEETRDWSAQMKDPYVNVYGAEIFQKMWSRHIEFYKTLGDICKTKLSAIRCPTFILHGDRDPLCHLDHMNYLAKNIGDTRTHRFPLGGHNIHIVFTEEFNNQVEDFLLE